MKDIQVINDVLNGEIDKYSLLIDKYHNELFQFLYNITGNVSDSFDLLQDIFYISNLQFDRYDSSMTSYRIWMYQMTVHHVLKYLKTNQQLIKEALTNKEDQLCQVFNSMKRRILHKRSYVLLLCYFSNLTNAEISKATDYSEKSIKKTVLRYMGKPKSETINCSKVNKKLTEDVFEENKEKLIKHVMNRLYDYRKEHK